MKKPCIPLLQIASSKNWLHY